MNATQLKMWRAASNLTQDDVAKLLNVSRATVIRWEAGKHRIPPNITQKLGPAPVDTAATPAEILPYRFRPYPGPANRDYTIEEVERLRVGVLVWRLVLADPTHWAVKRISARGFTQHGNNITLPPSAFPDPHGPEASWARAAFTEAQQKENAYQAAFEQAIKTE